MSRAEYCAAYYGDPRFTQDVDIVVDLAVNRT